MMPYVFQVIHYTTRTRTSKELFLVPTEVLSMRSDGSAQNSQERSESRQTVLELSELPSCGLQIFRMGERGTRRRSSLRRRENSERRKSTDGRMFQRKHPQPHDYLDKRSLRLAERGHRIVWTTWTLGKRYVALFRVLGAMFFRRLDDGNLVWRTAACPVRNQGGGLKRSKTIASKPRGTTSSGECFKCGKEGHYSKGE
jgi:hypothetical protein